MRFSEHFGIHREQPELDFVDVDPARDLPLFLDPFVLARRPDLWSQECTTDVISFFQSAIDAIRGGDGQRARWLLQNLSEPNETCLGLSSGQPNGRGVSGKQALDLYEKLAESRAAQTGFLSELADCELMVDGIGEDKISDITTNIIRRRLIHYTQTQCELHGVPLRGTVASGRLWDPVLQEWVQEHVALPVVNGRKIILVPKALVMWNMALQSQEYYQHFVLNFLQEEALRSGSSLVHVLKSGKQKVYKKDLKHLHSPSKEYLYRFSKEHPEVLEAYKASKGDFTPISNHDLQAVDERALAAGMIHRLLGVPAGNTDATAFHHLMIGVLEFIFYPNLICPQKELEIDQGRKRIDITYTNAAEYGLFDRALRSPSMDAKMVMVECKNYSHDPGNPELDQLAGRFSHTRGRFGLLVARTFVDRDRFIQRCRDTALAGRGYVLPLVDEDTIRMLELIDRGRRSEVDEYLSALLQAIMT